MLGLKGFLKIAGPGQDEWSARANSLINGDIIMSIPFLLNFKLSLYYIMVCLSTDYFLKLFKNSYFILLVTFGTTYSQCFTHYKHSNYLYTKFRHFCEIQLKSESKKANQMLFLKKNKYNHRRVVKWRIFHL